MIAAIAEARIPSEPGLYLPDWGGMRLEGTYLVTASGFVTGLDPSAGG